MEIIGEDMHGMNETFIRAMEDRDEELLISMARQQVEAGASALDVNLGQNRKLGRLTPWLVETLQKAMDVPLFMSSHVLSQQRGLEVHKGQATINAVTADLEGLGKAMETARYFRANLVVLLVSSKLTPFDVDGRLQLAVQVLDVAAKVGLPQEQIYLDPVITSRPDPIVQSLSTGLPDIDTLLDSINMLGKLAEPGLKIIAALSNASLCMLPGERSGFQCRLLPLLADAGLDAVIMNCRDKRLMEVAQNPAAIIEMAA
jgi:5-methyltetrahydrofolate corrinoid/iron sulfur protein methyltransferase